jgi:branched-subunit amino acid transport protein
VKLWLVFIFGGLLTYLTRLSFIALFGRQEIPDLVRRGLRFVPPAVLSAIIFQELLIRSAQLDVSPGNFRLIAGLAAGVVAWRSRQPLLVILAGMGVLLLLTLIPL